MLNRGQLVVIQATPFCNLECEYCYLPDRLNSSRITVELLQRIFEQLRTSSLIRGPFTLLWHAGEPLVAGLDFFEMCLGLAKDILDTPGRPRFSHCVQTNAVLLNHQWLRLFRSHQVNVGVSIDGPAEIHDSARRFRTGAGSHAAVMRGIETLRGGGYPFSAIAVVRRATLPHALEFFEFFRSLGASRLGLNVEEQEGANARSSLEPASTRHAIQDFYRELIRLNLQAGFPLRIRELQPFEAALRGHPFSPADIFNAFRPAEPFDIISFDYRGNVSTFSPELIGTKAAAYNDFILGNILEDRLDNLATSRAFLNLRDDILRGIRACEDTCGYFKVCCGGQPANKYFEHGRFDVTETLFCRTKVKALVDVVLEELENPHARGRYAAAGSS